MAKQNKDACPEVVWVSRNLKWYGNCFLGKSVSPKLMQELKERGLDVVKTKKPSGMWLELKEVE